MRIQIVGFVLALLTVAGQARAACVFSESQGAGALAKDGGSVTGELRIRAEAECEARFGTLIAGRLDGVSRPGSNGSSKPLTFADLATLASLEGWLRVRKPLLPHLSLAAVFGAQRSIQGGTLGLGGPSSTFGIGAHVEAAGAWLDVYVVDKYTPSGPGAKGVAAVSLPVMKGVRFTATAGGGPHGRFVETAMMVGK